MALFSIGQKEVRFTDNTRYRYENRIVYKDTRTNSFYISKDGSEYGLRVIPVCDGTFKANEGFDKLDLKAF